MVQWQQSRWTLASHKITSLRYHFSLYLHQTNNSISLLIVLSSESYNYCIKYNTTNTFVQKHNETFYWNNKPSINVLKYKTPIYMYS